VTQKVISRATPEGTVRHEYDPATGQLRVTWTGTANTPTAGSGITTQTAYGYDTQGRLEHVYAFKIGGTSQGVYTGWNSTTQEPTYTGTPLITTYTYDKAGNLDRITQPNGVFTQNHYDELNRLDQLTVYKSYSGNKLFEQAFTLNNNGLRGSVIEKRYDGTSSTPFSKVKITWKYDDMDRLVEETRDADSTPGDANDNFDDGIRDSGDYSEAFAYDLVSNRVKKTSGWDANSNGSFTDSGDTIDSTTLYTYNSNDQLTAEGTDANSNGVLDSGEITTSYTYDANGSQLTQTQGSTTTKYLWDLRNRMVGLDANNDGDAVDTGDTEYAYDSNGVRVNQLTHGATNSANVYLNDNDNPTGYPKTLEKKTGTSIAGATLDTTYVLGLRVEGQKDPAGTVWFLRDGHGSNRLLTDSTGAPVSGQSYDYRAFGEAIGFTPSSARTIEQFGGDGVFDAATGWTYQLARWRSGFRFVSMDDVFYAKNFDPISLHKYLYANANPIGNFDPSGHTPAALFALGEGIFIHGAIAFVVGAMISVAATISLAVMDNAGVSRPGEREYLEAMQAMGISIMKAGVIMMVVGGILMGIAMIWSWYLNVVGTIGVIRSALSVCSQSFVASTPVLLANGKTKEAIEEIHVGQRVATGAPFKGDHRVGVPGVHSSRIHSKAWRVVTIDADDWRVQSLVPVKWIHIHHIVAHGFVRLTELVDVAEMGAPESLIGKVESVSAAPKIKNGRGRVVLTTVSHLSETLYQLSLVDMHGKTDDLGVTAYHPFYTEDHGWECQRAEDW
jgi:hypothetical protein